MTDADKIKTAYLLGRAYEAMGAEDGPHGLRARGFIEDAMGILGDGPTDGYFKGYDSHGMRLPEKGKT